MKSVKIVSIVGVLIFALVTVFAVLQISKTAETTSSNTTAINSMESDITSCLPESYGTEEEYKNAKIYECLYDHLVTSAARGGADFINTTSALESYSKEDAVFGNICHLAAHDAGSFHAKQTDPVSALELTSDFCFSGFVHGVFDFLGAANYSTSEWQEIAYACEKISSERPMACADGLGHASWDFMQNPEKAFENCEIFTLSDKVAECAEGVVMQMFQPAVVKESSKILPSPKDKKTICKDLENSSVQKGCFFGIGWLLGNEVATVSAPYLYQGDYPNNQKDNLLRVFTASLDSCMGLAEGSPDCLARFFTSIPYPIWQNADLRLMLCETNSLVSETCFSVAQAMVGS